MRNILFFLMLLVSTTIQAQQLSPTTKTIAVGSSTNFLITDDYSYFGDNSSPNLDIDDWEVSTTSSTSGFVNMGTKWGYDYRGTNPISLIGTNFSTAGTYYIRNHTGTFGYSLPMTVTAINSSVTQSGSVTPASQSICSGGTPSLLSLTGFVGTNITFQWFKVVGGVQTIIAGATGMTYQPSSITQNTTYFVREYDIEGTSVGYPNSATANVYSTMTSGTFTNKSICYNTSTSITEATAPSGGSGNYTYTWTNSTDGITYNSITGANSPSYATPNLTATRYYKRKVTDATCGYTATSSAITVTVYADVTAGAVGTAQTICNGSTPSLLTTLSTPTGSDGVYTYKWQSSTDNVNFNDISGATGTTYQPLALTTTTYFRKNVICICGSYYTPSVKITVNGVVNAGTISSNQNTCYLTAPAPIGSSVLPSGGSGVYTLSWESSPNNSTWTTIVGANTSSYQPSPLTSNIYYRMKVVDASCGFAYTNSVLITIKPIFISGSIKPNQTICYNTVPNPLVNDVDPSGGSNSYTYQWEYCVNGTDWFNIPSATGASYQPSLLSSSTSYRRKVIDASCGFSYTNTVSITVKPNFNGGVLGSSQTTCYLGTPTALGNLVAPSGGMGIYTYQYEVSTNGTDFFNVNGATGVSYQAGALTQSTYYRRRVSDSQCGSVYNSPILITVRPNFVAGTIGTAQTMCSGATPSTLVTTLSATGGSGPYNFQWQESLDNGTFSDIENAVSETYNPGPMTSSKYFRRKDTDASCGFSYSNSVLITVRAPFVVGEVGADQTTCFNGSPELLSSTIPNGGGTGVYSFQWESMSLGSSSWNLIVGATGEGYLPSNLVNTTKFRRKVTDLSCGSGYSNVVTLTVRDILANGIIGSNQQICYNSIPQELKTVSLPTGGTLLYTWRWQSSTDNVTWSDITSATNENYQPSALISSMYYRRAETSGSCGTVYSNSIMVNVNNPLVAGSVKSDQTICSLTAPSTLITNTYPTGATGTYTYGWQKLVGTTWTDQGVNTETYTPAPLAQTSYFRRAETSGSCGTVYSNQITINVYSQFTAGVIGSSHSVYYNSTPNELVSIQAASGGSGGYTYQWLKSEDGTTFSTITNATSENYQSSALTVKTYFKRRVTSVPCGTLESNTLTVDVTGQIISGEIQGVQTVCFSSIPNPITSKVNPSGGSGTYTFSWLSSEDGSTWNTVIAETGASLQPQALSKTTYFKRGATSAGVTVYSNIVSVTVLDKINEPVTDLKNHYCKGSNISVSILNPTYTTYKWYNYLNNYIQDGTKLLVNNFSTDGKYYVRSSSSNGCLSNPIELIVKVDPIAAHFTHDIESVSLGNAVRFTSTSTGATAFLWNFYDGDLIQEENPIHYYNVCNGTSQKFNVCLTVTSSDNCKDSLKVLNAITVLNPSSDVDIIGKTAFSVFPNPIRSSFRIVGFENLEAVYIYNVIGNLVMKLERGSDLSSTIDISNLYSGVYFLKGFTKNGSSFNVKIVKE